MKVLARISHGTLGSLIAVVFSMVIILAPSCKKKETPVHKELPPPVVGNPAPVFTLKDVGGNNVSLSDFKGKIVVVDFWTTWCSWCKETVRELEKLHRDYKGRDVVFLGVSMDTGDDAGKKVKDFARRYGLTYTMLMDDGSVSRSYEINKIPTTYILDKDHIIRQIYPGYLPGLGKRIAEAIEESLSESRG